MSKNEIYKEILKEIGAADDGCNERCDRQQATDNGVELARKIKDALHEIELLEKPFLLFIHPNDYQKMQEVGVPEEALRRYKIIETPLIPKEKLRF